MPLKKKQGKSSARPARGASSDGRSPRDANTDGKPVVDERAIARKNTKPRSARASSKGPSER